MVGRRTLRSCARPALFLACLLAPACRSQERPDEPPDPRFGHALEGLERAVDAGEDETARRILAALMARGPEGRALELARDFGVVLEGRALAEELEFSLEAERLPAPEEGASSGAYRLGLFCRNETDLELELHLPPPTLELLVNRVYPNGSDARNVEYRVVVGLTALVLEPGETVRIDLGTFSPEPQRALARRDVWKLDTRSGELVAGGEPYPLRAPEVEPREVVTLAPWLPPEPVEPEVLLEYVRRDRISTPALLERTIRIPPERWLETLERLEPVVAVLSDERLTEIAPALRWLSRSARLGRDAISWRQVLSHLDEDAPPPAALDLPDPTPAP